MFTGSIVALITPMNEKSLIDLVSLKKLINYHINNGTTAILVAGTTGEALCLNYKERNKLIMQALEFSDGRIPIIAGIHACSTKEAISLTNYFNDSGIAGYLSVTPYYNCPSQEGLFQHFKCIAENSNLPHILYNVPARTGCDMLPLTVSKLSKIKNIIGIKEATGNLNRVSQIRELVDTNFLLLSGNDAIALDFMQLGGKGVISVTANIAAKDMAQLCYCAASGNYTDASRINRRLMHLHYKLFFEPNPIPVKWACRVLNLIKNDTIRLPMTQLTESGIRVVGQALKDAGLM